MATLFHFYQGELYLAMEWLPVSLSDLFRFMETRVKLQQHIEDRKKQRFLELGEEAFFQTFFMSEKEVVRENEGYEHCGRKKENGVLCPACASFVDFTDELKKSRYLLEEEVPPLERFPQKAWEVFECLGFWITFSQEAFPSKRVYRLGEASLGTERKGRLADGFLPGSFRLPEATFKEISRSSIQDGYGDLALVLPQDGR